MAILTPLADEFAREGFAAKAIAVLKKIQKIDPGLRDVEAKLANLIQDKQRVATVAPPPAATMPEFGMEEIGFEAGAGARRAEPSRRHADARDPEAEPDRLRAGAAPEPRAAARARRPRATAPLPPPVEDRDLIDETAEDELPLEGLPDLALDADAELPAAAEPELTPEPEIELQAEPEIQPEPEIEPEPPRADDREPLRGGAPVPRRGRVQRSLRTRRPPPMPRRRPAATRSWSARCSRTSPSTSWWR